MEKVELIKIEPFHDSNFVKPLRMTYSQDGVQKIWDFNKIHDSVCILIFNVTRNVFVFVKQFRPAVFFNSISADASNYVTVGLENKPLPIEEGITLELCAGIVDKEKSLEEIARDEILEECGYNVPLTNIEKIISYRDSIGIAGDKQTLLYAEVTDDMRVSKGGGNVEEGELIDVVEMSEADVRKYIERDDVCSPGGLLFAILWFFQNERSIHPYQE